MSEIKLKINTETIHTLYYNDLESFVYKVYGVDYSFVATEECGNNSSFRFNISSKEEANADCKDITKENIYKISNYEIFCKLITDGYLEPGNYLVRVCW